MDYQFELVNLANYTKYQKFTFSWHRNVFDSGIHDSYLGIGAFAEGMPLGLILGKPNKEYPCEMSILSVFVIADYRRKGIATALFRQFETEVKQQGYQRIAIKYIDDRESIGYIEKILAYLGWDPPQVSDYIYKCRIFDCNYDWLDSIQYMESFSDCTITELTGAEKAYLREGSGVWYPEGLSPFAMEEKIVPELTRFLKCRGEIIGWCGTIQASAETLAYRSIFIKKEFQGTGMIIFLLYKVMRIHLQVMNQFPYAAFQVAVTNKIMEKFGAKLTKEFVSITPMMISYKII